MIICKAFVTLVLLGLEFFFKPIYLYPIDFYFLFFWKNIYSPFFREYIKIDIPTQH